MWRMLAGALVVAVVGAMWPWVAHGAGPEITPKGVESRFPEGILFRVEAQSDAPITRLVLRFRVGNERSRRFQPVDITPAPRIATEVFIRTDTAARYIPPGARIEYLWEVEDQAGNRRETAPDTFVLLDPRWTTWESLQQGQVTVYFYAPIRTRAQTIAQAVEETFQKWGPVLGVETFNPVTVVVYTTYRDMLPALPPTSRTVRTQLVTEGTTFADQGVIVMLASGPAVRGIASHEAMHFLLDAALANRRLPIPVWFNEGIAEMGNLAPTTEYDQALFQALRRGTLLPITDVESMPGRPDDVILVYGQGKAMVKFILEQYGEERLRQLLRLLDQNIRFRDAFQQVYGTSLLEVENAWRRTIGAPLRAPLADEAPLPTPIPLPTIIPFGVPTPPAVVPTPTPETVAPAPTPTPRPPTRTGGCAPGRTAAGDGLLVVGGVVVLSAWGWLRRRR
ncbi:MAG: peptidase MA family metallohydrolase [Dehalococcoidia bacterium]|nr:peptidase MA family metallohydrolase [Dehalococcoidia bacterium]MDW8120089.1 peptidase MA family metallohydrolase [Chloroflexota bacterium]